MRRFFLIMICAAAAIAPCAGSVPMMMSYQGKLTDAGGQPAGGIHNMRFYLHDQEAGGSLLWQEPAAGSPAREVQVTGGLFNVILGSVVALPDSAFQGSTWLGTEVDGVLLTPRIRIVSTGYAIHSGLADTVPDGAVKDSKIADMAWSKLTGVPTGLNDGDDDTTYKAGDGLSLSSNEFSLDAAYTDGLYWRLGGNAGTTVGPAYLGTSDDQALELKVNGLRALRLEPNISSPNVIGGYSFNSALSGVYGAVIGGGGGAANTNRVTDHFATVGGGYNNRAGDGAGDVGDRQYATVGGGLGNQANGTCSTVPGGQSNVAVDYAFAAGRRAIANHTGAFVWADSTNADFASTSINQFLIRASGGVGIGTSSPAAVLDAVSAGATDAVRGYTTGDTGSEAGWFEINNPASSSSALRGETNGSGSAVRGYTTGSGWAGYFSGTGSAKGIYVSVPPGNLALGVLGSAGVGTLTPAATFDAVSSTTTDAVRGYTTGATGSSAGRFRINNAGNASEALHVTTNGTGPAVYAEHTGTGRAAHFRITNASNNLEGMAASTVGGGKAVSGYTTGTGSAGYFEVNNTANESDAVYITNNGRGHSLYVAKSGMGDDETIQAVNTGYRGAGRFEIENEANQDTALHAETNGSGFAASFEAHGDGRGVHIWCPPANAALMIPGGRVEIGDVSVFVDNVLAIEDASPTDPIADAWTTYSSARWKTNVEPISDALDKIRRLRGVSFDWKKGGKHDIGLIAEEVGKVIPEVVVYEENRQDARSVDYARLVAVLIEGMKEQQETIDKMEAEIEALKAVSAKD